MAGSLVSPNLTSLCSRSTYHSFQTRRIKASQFPPILTTTRKHRSLVKRASKSSDDANDKEQASRVGINMKNNSSSPQTHQVVPTKPKVPIWVGAVLGSIFLGLPCWIVISSGGDEMVKKVDLGEALDIERTAEMTKKIGSELGDKLPNDSDLKKLVSIFEHETEEVNKNAKLIDSFIHKIDEVKSMLQELMAKEKVTDDMSK